MEGALETEESKADPDYTKLKNLQAQLDAKVLEHAQHKKVRAELHANRIKLERDIAAAKAGKDWSRAEELKRELLIVKMRGAVDPKRFYRSSDYKGKGELPKFFQLGTLVEGAGGARLTSEEGCKRHLLLRHGVSCAVDPRARTQAPGGERRAVDSCGEPPASPHDGDTA